MARSPSRPRRTAPTRTATEAGEQDEGPIILGARPASQEEDDGPLIISSVANHARRTSRTLVLLPAGATQEGARILANKAGLKLQSAAESGAAAPTPGFAKVMPRLGVAVAAADPDQAAALAAAVDPRTGLPLPPEEEFVLYTAGMDPAWLRGYRDAVMHIADRLLDGEAPPGAGEVHAPAAAAAGTAAATWGVLATRAARSGLDGSGVRIAVLDTGIDLTHPDFEGRVAEAISFIDGEPEQDGNGHGTHCAGVACRGGAPVGTMTRYGIAGAADLYIAKVLSNLGEGPEQGILQGIEWAIEKGCRIVSMSLSGQAQPSPLFEQVGRRTMDAGTLLIAAAGNDSSRPSRLMPVGYPANCESIMAVAALDRKLAVARFSNLGSDGGGKVDIAAPGVGVMSAWAGRRRYWQESGTSMATPFVAGIACLILQRDPGLDARALWQRLADTARSVGGRPVDVGAGLVQAPS